MDAIVLLPGEGETLSLRPTRLRYLAESADSGGGYGLVEYAIAPGGPSLRRRPRRRSRHGLFGGIASDALVHVHDGLYDAFYVLEGELQLTLGEETLPAPAGTFVLVPPGVPHTFANPGPEPARFLSLHAPGGFERYFKELAAALPADGPPDRAQLAELDSRYDFRAVAPR